VEISQKVLGGYFLTHTVGVAKGVSMDRSSSRCKEQAKNRTNT